MPGLVWASICAGSTPSEKPGIDDFVRQAVSGESAALDDRVEAHLFGVANAVFELGEGLAVVKIRHVHDVSGIAESIGEGEAPSLQAVRVMKEQNLSHVPGL